MLWPVVSIAFCCARTPRSAVFSPMNVLLYIPRLLSLDLCVQQSEARGLLLHAVLAVRRARVGVDRRAAYEDLDDLQLLLECRGIARHHRVELDDQHPQLLRRA